MVPVMASGAGLSHEAKTRSTVRGGLPHRDSRIEE